MHDKRDLLPFPPWDGSHRGPDASRPGGRHRQRQLRRALIADQVADMAGAVNSLYGIGSPGVTGEDTNSRQQSALRHFVQLGEEACRRGLWLREEAPVTSDGATYMSGVVERALWLEPNKVSLPLNEVAASASMIDLLPEVIAEKYSDGKYILLSDVAEEDDKRPFRRVKSSKYRELISRLCENGMVRLQHSKPKVINGIFGVPKGDEQRLIIDAQNANRRFRKPDDPALPNPGDLASLTLGPNDSLYFTKSDLDNFYHRLLLPEWMREYFGLPPIVIDGVESYPVVQTLPMGWSHSVLVAQAIHTEILKSAGLNTGLRIVSRGRVDEFRFGSYIDDYFSLGTNEQIAKENLKRVIAACEDANIPAKERKLVWPDATVTNILGIEFQRDGLLRPDKEKLQSLINFTNRFVLWRKWNVRTLQRLLGRWAWVVLLRRCLFSVFERVYIHANETTRVTKPNKRARNELRLICRLAPFIRSDLKKPFSELIICSDASTKGGGVVYFKSSREVARELYAMTGTGHESWIESRSWMTAIRHKWVETSHIHLLEGEALILAIRWFLRCNENLHKRVLIFVDNEALIGAVRKGRSSKCRFNRICQRVAALSLAGNIDIHLFYIQSEKNSADGPSRFQ